MKFFHLSLKLVKRKDVRYDNVFYVKTKRTTRKIRFYSNTFILILYRIPFLAFWHFTRISRSCLTYIGVQNKSLVFKFISCWNKKMKSFLLLAVIIGCIYFANAEVYFEEKFADGKYMFLIFFSLSYRHFCF